VAEQLAVIAHSRGGLRAMTASGSPGNNNSTATISATISVQQLVQQLVHGNI